MITRLGGTETGTIDIVDKAMNYIDRFEGGVTYRSDKGTYPRNAQVDENGAPFARRECVRLECTNSVTADDLIKFAYQGNFGVQRSGELVMANVFFDMERNSAVFGTRVEFQASLNDTIVGTPESPRLQFFLTGKLASLGAGSCRFSATIQIGVFRSSLEPIYRVVDARIIEGEATVRGLPGDVIVHLKSGSD